MSAAKEIDSHLPLGSPANCDLAAERLARITPFFRSYIEKKKLAGFSTLVARGGQIAHFECDGTTSLEAGQPVAQDTIFRIYSMTKPITSVALMMLFEQGLFRLDNPVEKFLPEFKNIHVWAGGNNLRPRTRPAMQPVTIHNLLTHTSGLTYGFMHTHPIDRFYRQKKIGENVMTLEEMVKTAAQLPLLFEPGQNWNYSISTDVCGRLVEVISGQPLDEFLHQNIFAPLKMADTGFFVPESKIHRLMANYQKHPRTGELSVIDPHAAASPYAKKPAYLSGGGGLVSTAGDYFRFCQMLLNGGTLDGATLLSPKTINFMTMNHLPGSATLDEISLSTFSENRFEGTGFGLGFSIVMNPAAVMLPVSAGTYSWGGAASTFFWIDPVEEMIGIFMTQFMPSDYYPLRPQLQQLAYAAIQ